MRKPENLWVPLDPVIFYPTHVLATESHTVQIAVNITQTFLNPRNCLDCNRQLCLTETAGPHPKWMHGKAGRCTIAHCAPESGGFSDALAPLNINTNELHACTRLTPLSAKKKSPEGKAKLANKEKTSHCQFEFYRDTNKTCGHDNILKMTQRGTS